MFLHRLSLNNSAEVGDLMKKKNLLCLVLSFDMPSWKKKKRKKKEKGNEEEVVK